ncbi:hypothetical protein BN1051_00492 [Arthrobacter saudimassiliensis]|uniref:Uncharacterized protein n=1 Tax=Arthrobacter saudimassiliensis TaxID=1461584 RepID=A0A078MLN7_9MICC|nr:hypothetical protein BN1051_00492 [Arthrobacter saudimassiliensis]
MLLSSFFKDRMGRQTIIEKPNAPLLAAAGFGAASLMALTPRYQTLMARLARWSLGLWAALEAFGGESWFRRTVGAWTLSRVLLPGGRSGR